MSKKSTLVANRYDRRTIGRLTRELLAVWRPLNIVGHRSDAHPIVQEHVTDLLESPLFRICRDLREDRGKPLSDDAATAAVMLEHFTGRKIIAQLAGAFCETLQTWEHLIQSLRKRAKTEEDPEAKALLDQGVITLKATAWGPRCCGLLAELPSTAGFMERDDELLAALATVLAERYDVMTKAAAFGNFEPWIRQEIGQMRGLSLFSALRAQRHKRTEAGPEGLVEWLGQASPAFRRRFLQSIGEGLHEVALTGRMIRGAMLQARNPGLLRCRLNAVFVTEITLSNVLRTGVFDAVAA